MNLLKAIILKIIPKRIRRLIAKNEIELFKNKNKYSNISYSQEGEDLIIECFLGAKKNGFYIDVGAHHPMRFSNTYKFYLKGWRGINIDATPGSMDLFNELRAEDINLEVAIANNREELNYYIFNEPALNTFSESEALKKDGVRNFKILKKVEVSTDTLSNILNYYLRRDQNIDFMTVDVEGLDLEVLNSNDWTKYRPNYILAEDLSKNKIADIPTHSKIYQLLATEDYELIAKSFNTLFFRDTKL